MWSGRAKRNLRPRPRSTIRLIEKRLSSTPDGAQQLNTMTNGRPVPPLAASNSSTTAWTVHDASELYECPRWSNRNLSVYGHEHLQVHLKKDAQLAIDLIEH